MDEPSRTHCAPYRTSYERFMRYLPGLELKHGVEQKSQLIFCVSLQEASYLAFPSAIIWS